MSGQINDSYITKYQSSFFKSWCFPRCNMLFWFWLGSACFSFELLWTDMNSVSQIITKVSNGKLSLPLIKEVPCEKGSRIEKHQHHHKFLPRGNATSFKLCNLRPSKFILYNLIHNILEIYLWSLKSLVISDLLLISAQTVRPICLCWSVRYVTSVPLQRWSQNITYLWPTFFFYHSRLWIKA